MFILWLKNKITSVAIICSTTALHNICILHKLDEIVKENVHNNVFEVVYNHEEDGIGLAHRNAFILRHFS